MLTFMLTFMLIFMLILMLIFILMSIYKKYNLQINHIYHNIIKIKLLNKHFYFNFNKMEGTLHKWTNYLWGYCERYFVLKGTILYYFLKKGEKAKGRFHLSVCTIPNHTKDLRFEIDVGMNVLCLKAESNEERDEWVKSLKSAKRDADRQLQNNNNNNTNNIENTILPSNRYDSTLMDNTLNLNRNHSFMPDDKLLSKVNSIVEYSNKLFKDNNNMKEIIEKYESNKGGDSHLEDLKKLHETYNVSYYLMYLII